MKKITLSLLLALILLVNVSVVGLAADQSSFLQDNAQLLVPYELETIAQRLDEINQEHDVEIFIVTENSIGSQGTRAYAEQFGDNAVVLLVVMDQRDFSITATGDAKQALTNAAIDDVLNEITDEMLREDFAGAFEEYIQQCDSLLAVEEEPFGVKLAKGIGVSLLIGLVIALIATGIMASKLKSVHAKAGAADYVKSGSMNVTLARDMFLYRKVNRRPKPKSTSSSSGGSSGSNHGSRKF